MVVLCHVIASVNTVHAYVYNGDKQLFVCM